MENNETKEVREYTNEDVFKVIGKLPKDYQDILLTHLTISDIRKVVNSKKDFEEYYSSYLYYGCCCQLIANTLKEIYETIESKLEEDAKDFSADYDKLSDFEKKQTALEMLNNKDFQKNCCEIMVGDYERIVSEDPTCKAIDKLFGLWKYFRKCIETGLGCDHKYMVCDKKRS